MSGCEWRTLRFSQHRIMRVCSPHPSHMSPLNDARAHSKASTFLRIPVYEKLRDINARAAILPWPRSGCRTVRPGCERSPSWCSAVCVCVMLEGCGVCATAADATLRSSSHSALAHSLSANHEPRVWCSGSAAAARARVTLVIGDARSTRAFQMLSQPRNARACHIISNYSIT